MNFRRRTYAVVTAGYVEIYVYMPHNAGVEILTSTVSAEFLTRFMERGLAILCDDSGGASSKRAVLVAPAEKVTAQAVNDILNISGGHLHVAISAARANALLLSPMSRPNVHGTAAAPSQGLLNMCISVEAREGVTTGISAADRAVTIRTLGQKSPNPRHLVKPGHIFPVEVKDGGVLVKNSLPEGALDLVRISGGTDAALFVELIDARGEFFSCTDISALAQQAQIPMIELSKLVRYRLETEKLVYRVAEARLPTRLAGEVRSIVYRSTVHSGEHMALVKGSLDLAQPILTRVQAEFTFGDVFGGNNPPTRVQLCRALEAIGKNGNGVLLYLRRPTTGYLKDQVLSWNEKFVQRSAAMMREYGLGAQILHDLGVQQVRLLTGSRKSLIGLRPFGIEIVSQEPL